jgi:hypothetical protein
MRPSSTNPSVVIRSERLTPAACGVSAKARECRRCLAGWGTVLLLPTRWLSLAAV